MSHDRSNMPAETVVSLIWEFEKALAHAGLILRGRPDMDGTLHRAPVMGDRPGRRSGAYVGHLDGRPAGHITNWKTGLHMTWRAGRKWQEAGQGRGPPFGAALWNLVEAKQDAMARRQAQTSRYAARVWESAAPALADHPYLTRKRVAAHGLRISRAGSLLIPAHDIEHRIWSLIRIKKDGAKRFLRGGRIEGCFYAIGRFSPMRPILITEGFATAATLHETTGLPVAVAMASGNLGAVARVIRSHYRRTSIIMAADNDHHLPLRDPPLPNVGKLKAEEAARSCEGIVLIPTFKPEDKGTDWNDLAISSGTGTVRLQLASCRELRRYLTLC